MISGLACGRLGARVRVPTHLFREGTGMCSQLSSVLPSVCLSIHLPLFCHLSSVSYHLSIVISVFFSLHPSVSLLSVHLSIHLCVCLSQFVERMCRDWVLLPALVEMLVFFIHRFVSLSLSLLSVYSDLGQVPSPWVSLLELHTWLL